MPELPDGTVTLFFTDVEGSTQLLQQHTGEPNVRDDAYFGLDVHRAARIAQAGSGGQVCLGSTSPSACSSSTSPGCRRTSRRSARLARASAACV